MPRPAVGARGGARRSQQDSEDRSGAWLTTYADAVTLLMAFFVMLYAMSEVDVVKFTAFLEGLATPFGNQAGEGLLPEASDLPPEDLPTDVPGPQDHPATAEPAPSIPVDRVSPEMVEALQRRAASNDQLDVVAHELSEALVARDLERFVEQRREERGLVVSVASDDVLFSLGSTAISALGREVIEVVAVTLDGFPNPLLIEGHTDDLPLDRHGYTNWNLSTDRAVAVLQLMLDDHGLPPERVGAVGYGEHHPLADNATASGRARNRRVDIVVLIEESSP